MDSKVNEKINENEKSNEKSNEKVKEKLMKNNEKVEDRLLTTEQISSMVKVFNPADLTQDSFIYVCAPRRSGKSTLVEDIIHNYRKKHKVDAVFLFSKSQAGFYQIPSAYRFRSLDNLQNLIDIQIRVKKYNQKQKKDSDKVSSKVIVILDDMLDGSKSMRSNKLLTKLSTMGRHIAYKKEHNDLKDNGIMVICISQDFIGINPTIRRNIDWCFATKIPDRNQRKALVEQYLCLKTGRNGLKEAYSCFDIVNEKDFQFLCINSTNSNRYEYDDYVYKYVAKDKLPEEKWSGSEQDWKNNFIEIVW